MPGSNLVGQVLLNRFLIDSFIAAGGTGAVYKAWDRQRTVYLAMKVLSVDIEDDPSAYQHFVREAEYLKNLSHPNIVPFYGLYQDRGLHFLLEAFINGTSLNNIIRTRGALPLPEAMEYLRAVSAALGYAHVLHIIHSDVKPGNVMRDDGGSIYLTDFGISHHMDSTTTTSFGPAGTPAYMSPEQVRGERFTPAADVYSLGILFFELVTGRRPFLGNEKGLEPYGETSKQRVMAAHLYLAPPDPRQINPTLPAGLTPVLLKAIEKDPANRYASPNDFYQAANAVFEDEGLAGHPFRVPTPLPTEYELATDAIKENIVPRRRSFNWSRIALFLVAGLGMGGICLALWFAGFWRNLPTAQYQALAATITPEPSLPATQIAILSKTAANTLEPSPPAARIAVPSKTPAIPLITHTPTVLPTARIIPPTLPPSGVPSPETDQRVSAQDGMELIRIPAGPFQMGSDSSPWSFESPQHSVNLDEYWIDKIPVTNAMFAKFIEETQYRTSAEKSGWGYVSPGKGEFETQGANWQHPYGPESNLVGKENFPVVQVTWNEAQAYCTWAGRRMLSEAEWEKAARGEDARLYPWGNEIDCSRANYSSGNDSYCTGQLTSVDAYPAGASPYGVLDMAGNSWDWVADWYQADYYRVSPSKNPTGPVSGERRVHRGGSWYNFDLQVQVSYRYSNPPNRSFSSVGIRCGYSE